jgi:2-polyprenyl-6-hydroxyphenyl methylase/3-demethylubiquinone-9 3-methyltransferase
MSDTQHARPSSTLDEGEVRQFGRIAAEWWNPAGKFRMLHRIGPTRLQFIRDSIVQHFQPTMGSLRVLDGRSVLDIGCGGGLVCEPLARLGGAVSGIDPSQETIAAAKSHAAAQGLNIDYRVARVEDLLAEGRTFDCVLCLEVVEHVPDVSAFLAACAQLVRPGGLMLLSTINRTLKSYALAIVGAEYVLRWLPAGTHQWDRFVTPEELARHLKAAGLVPGRFEGMIYDPLGDSWRLSSDTGVNYLAVATRPAR